MKRWMHINKYGSERLDTLFLGQMKITLKSKLKAAEKEMQILKPLKKLFQKMNQGKHNYIFIHILVKFDDSITLTLPLHFIDGYFMILNGKKMMVEKLPNQY